MNAGTQSGTVPDRAATLETLLAIAREAAVVVLGIYTTDFAVHFKGPRDPVTQADRDANALICGRLAEQFPGVPIVAEESEEGSMGDWRGAERAFFVDPIDGTLEFIQKNGEFVVMIGLAEKGQATVGVVLAPASGVAWIGALGIGAFKVSAAGERTPVRVSPTERLENASVMLSRSRRAATFETRLQRTAPCRVTIRGSAGLKAVAVADGEADLYLQPGRAGSRWDACAPDAIVTAAGGLFTDARGRAIDYGASSLANDDGFIASNGRLHALAVDLLRDEPVANA